MSVERWIIRPNNLKAESKYHHPVSRTGILLAALVGESTVLRNRTDFGDLHNFWF